MTARGIWQRWDQFLFEPVSPVPIAVYRILFGTLVVLNVLLLLPHVDNLFGEAGILPAAGSAGYTHRGYDPVPPLNILAMLPADRAGLYGFIAVFLAAAVCLTVGFGTRLSSIAVFVGLVALHRRNLAIWNAGDGFMRLAAFYLMFCPAGRALSVDRWLRARRGLESREPAPAAPVGQRLIQIQLAVVYLATLRWKLTGETWLDGTAVHYASHLVEFERFPVPFLFDQVWAIRLLTWGTLFVEFAVGALVWFRPLRYPVLAAGVLLHLGMEYSMNIPLFQWVMLSAFVLFVDPRDCERVIAALPRWLGRQAGTPLHDAGSPRS